MKRMFAFLCCAGGLWALAGGASAEELAFPAEAPNRSTDDSTVQVSLRAAAHAQAWGASPAAPDNAFAFNGQIPGPTVRARVGQTLKATLVNALDEPTTIHWHGMHGPWTMDGAPWNTGVVAPGGTFPYELPLTTPGTFWYHPHFDTHRQVDLGLYGVVVVEDPAEKEFFDADHVLVFDTAPETPDDAIHADCHGARRTIRAWLVNSQSAPTLTASAGQRVRVRLLNASNCGYLRIHWPSARQIAGDQGRLASPGELPVWLAPGDRVELEWAVAPGDQEVVTDVVTVGGLAQGAPPIALLSLRGEGAAAAPAFAALPWSQAAPTKDVSHTDIVYALTGSGRTNQWFINGEQFPNVTIPQVEVNATAFLEIRNISDVHHPFHLHGMSFEIVSIDGLPPAYRRIEDTLDLAPHQFARLRIVATNPGDWMAHCHILPHAEGGMMTVLRVGEATGPMP